jgi:hypothetical protein
MNEIAEELIEESKVQASNRNESEERESSEGCKSELIDRVEWQAFLKKKNDF